MTERPGSPPLDTSSAEEFFEYYAKESESPATIRRFETVCGKILQLVGSERQAAGLDVADIGCGAGAQALIWARRGHRVHGLDINEPLVNLGRKRAAEQGYAIEFQVGTATRLPWADQSMDVCIAPELLEHVAEWRECLDEFTRILRPNGVLYVSTTNAWCPRQQEFALPLYSWYPAPLKRYCERLAVTTRPQLVNHARYPAVNWFSYPGLRGELAKRGFRAYDRFDTYTVGSGFSLAGMVVRAMRAFPPLRLLTYVVTSYTLLYGVKN